MTYREAMGRQCIDEKFHTRLLALEKAGKRRPRRRRQAAVAAALCCVIGLGVFGLGTAAQHSQKDVPDPGITSAEEMDSIYVYRPTLSELPQLTFRQDGGTGSSAALDIALPAGWFVLSPSEAEFAAVFGQHDALFFEGEDVYRKYDVTAEVTYGGDGSVWIASLRGKDRTHGWTVFSIELSPDGLPPACMPINGDTTCTVWGTPVRAGCYQLMGSEYGGETVTQYVATFVRSGEETVGARVHVTMPDAAAGRELITRIVSQMLRPERALTLATLAPEEIPEWRSERLTEAAAYAEEGFGTYLPAVLPEGFRFHGAWRELGQNRNSLTVEWEWGSGYTNTVTVDRVPWEFEDAVWYQENDIFVGPVDLENPASWNLQLYNSVEKPNPPEGYEVSVACPLFRAEDLSLEVIETRMYVYPNQKKSSASFKVLLPDGVVLRVEGCGTAEEIWAMLRSIPAAGIGEG